MPATTEVQNPFRRSWLGREGSRGAKEKRSDCKLLTMGLVVDGQGFAKYSKLYPGNQYEGDTFQKIIEEMEQHRQGEKKGTIVMDAGIATKANITWLKEHEYSYIVVCRGKTPFELDFHHMSLIREDRKRGIKIEVQRCEDEKQDELYLLVRSEGKQKKESSMMGRCEQLLLDRLNYYKSGLGKKHHVKKYPKVLEMVGRLKEKYARAASLYEITVVPEKKGPEDTATAEDIRWEKKEPGYEEKRKSEGSYVLRTNRTDLTDEQIWHTYITLGRIETAFKDMKSHLGLRPNFHQLEDRVDAHMFISLLAYHLMHGIEHTLKCAGDSRTWWSIKTTLFTHQRMTVEYISKDAEEGRFLNTLRTNSRLEPAHLEIYTKLGLSGRPLNRRLLKREIGSDNKNNQVVLQQ